jgi:quercetin dioxygenase-like cupin family protein
LLEHSPWSGSPLHIHRDADEWFYVVKGEFVWEVGGKLYRLVEGGSMVAPHKIPHRYLNGPARGTLFAGLTPGDGLEGFAKRTALSWLGKRLSTKGAASAVPNSRSQ